MDEQIKYWLVAITSPIVAIALQILLSSYNQDLYFAFYISSVLVSTAYGGKKFGSITLLVLSFSNLLPTFFGVEDQTILYTNIVSIIIFTIEAVLMVYLIDHFRQTDQVNQERKKVKKLEQQLYTLGQKFKIAQEEIKVRDEFLSIASHELKTPLTAMVLQLQTALHNIKNVSLANFSVKNLLNMLEKVENQTNRLSRIINDLLNASRVSSRKLNLKKEEFDIGELVAQVVDNFNEEAEENGNLIKVETKKGLIGKWDKIRIEQAIANLVSNAIKYGEKKPVNIYVTNSKNKVKIQVKDNGIGIADEDLSKIFTLFERAHENKKIEGTGVGLYITDRIVKAHGGKIEVKSKKGQGSEFIINLPLD